MHRIKKFKRDPANTKNEIKLEHEQNIRTNRNVRFIAGIQISEYLESTNPKVHTRRRISHKANTRAFYWFKLIRKKKICSVFSRHVKLTLHTSWAFLWCSNSARWETRADRAMGMISHDTPTLRGKYRGSGPALIGWQTGPDWYGTSKKMTDKNELDPWSSASLRDPVSPTNKWPCTKSPWDFSRIKYISIMW